MKKLTRTLMAVAALFAVSCTTDVTEDLATNFVGGGKATLTLSLEGTKTQLGEKAGDLYPLFWSEGDKISVNGVESSEAQISADNAAYATFSVAASTPYCIAYPAAPAGQVLFADKQAYVGNSTFASGVSTMYAYSADGLGVQMQHLTGVLKIGVTGSAKIVLAQISNVNRAPIAGAFEFDFEKGEIVKAAAGAKEVIEYSFGEGVELSDAPTYIHAAVPAGEYDELYVTLYDAEGGVMYATVKTDATKPLTAGNVREFSNNIAYAPNESVFIIRDVASLKAFAEQAATLEKDVLFVADVDMTGEAWTPIEGYAMTVRGNGYAIKGLTAPLFGTTNASFKGLHLRDVDINETVTPNVGALARCIEMPTNGIPVVIENCSVSGKITVNTPNFQFTNSVGKYDYDAYTIGGLIGRSYGITISDCVNNAVMDIQSIVDLSSVPSGSVVRPRIGGIAGALNDAPLTIGSSTSTVCAKMYNLTNNANISYSDFSYTGETTPSVYSPIQVYLAGVVGIHPEDNLLESEIQNIVNYGNVTVKGNFNTSCILTGTIGLFASTKISHIYNYGKISYTEGSSRYFVIGGAIGNGTKGSMMSNLHNHGEIYVGPETTCLSIVAGGVLGYQGSSEAKTDELKDSSNNAPISIYCKDISENPNKASTMLRIGGISGWNQVIMDNCNNLEGGKITVKANRFNNDSYTYDVCIGGLVGYKTVCSINNSRNDADIDIDVNLATSEGIDPITASMNIGGIVGYTPNKLLSITNNGDISVAGSYAGDLKLGGIAGDAPASGAHDSAVNNGKITLKANASVGNYLYMAGCFGNSKYTRLTTNNGEISVEDGVTVKGRAHIAGVIAYTIGNCNRLTNNGPINLGTGRSTDSAFIAGNVGWATVGVVDMYTMENHGAITSDFGSDNYLRVAGCFGYVIEEADENGKLKAAKTHECDNYAPITVTSSVATKRMLIGGIGTFLGGTSQNLTNHETGVLNITFNTTEHGYFGGICGDNLKDHATDCTNYGDINLSGTVYHTLYGAGNIVKSNNYKRTRCSNHGDITCSVKAETHNIFIGGFVYDSGANLTYIDCHNTGDIIATKECSSADRIELGGCVGKLEAASAVNIFDGCSNSGDIIIRGKNAYNYDRIGGAFGYANTGTIIVKNGFTNTGNIIHEGEHTGSQSMSLGGFAGQLNAAVKFINDANPSWTGDIINTGTIKFTGKSAKNVYMGGFVGASNATNTLNAKLINLGNIELKGEYPNAQVGGLYGLCKHIVNEGQVFCNIDAPTTAKAGLIMGTARTSTIKSVNCKVGGMRVTGWDTEDMDPRPLGEVIDESNYYNYIYSSVDWSSVDNYDGCTVISSKDEIVYTSTNDESSAQ